MSEPAMRHGADHFRWRAFRWFWRQKMNVPRALPCNSIAEHFWIIGELQYHRPDRRQDPDKPVVKIVW